MLYKLPSEHFDLLNSFKQVNDFPLIRSVYNSLQAGNIYVDDKNNIRVFLIMHKAGFAMLYAPGNFNNYEALYNFLMSNDDIPVYFQLYDPSTNIIKLFSQSNLLNYKLRERVQLVYDLNNLDIPGISMDNEFYAKQLNAQNIEQMEAELAVSINKFWNSYDQFFSMGWGTCIYDQQSNIVSACYSACVAGGKAEVDVVTKSGYQQKGLAKMATRHFINQCIVNNAKPSWDCFTSNTASLKIAEGLGFEQLRSYEFLSIYLKDKQNEIK